MTFHLMAALAVLSTNIAVANSSSNTTPPPKQEKEGTVNQPTCKNSPPVDAHWWE